MQAVIFDMDGVIFDSEAKGIECWKEVARRYGIQNIENTCYRCLGVNEKAVVQIFKATYGETFDFEFYSEKEREIFLSRYAGAKLPQKQGIKELLQWLKDNGIKTAVASSTNRETVKQELADGGLLDYFSVVIGGDMIERSKPAPEILLLLRIPIMVYVQHMPQVPKQLWYLIFYSQQRRYGNWCIVCRIRWCM